MGLWDSTLLMQMIDNSDIKNVYIVLHFLHCYIVLLYNITFKLFIILIEHYNQK